MGAATFNRSRRVVASKLAELKTEVPAAGMNMRETIVEELKRKHIQHSLDESKAMARVAKDDMEGNARGVETDLNSSDPGVGPAGTILNVGEMLAEEMKSQGPEASVVVVGGKIASRRDEPELLARFSSAHWAPPTSIHPGTDGVVPAMPDESPPPTSADPDNDTVNVVSPNALGNPKGEEQVAEDEKRAGESEKEVGAHAKELGKREEEAEERRNAMSVSTADQADRGELPNVEALEKSNQSFVKMMDDDTKRRLPEGATMQDASDEPVTSDNAEQRRVVEAEATLRSEKISREANIARREAAGRRTEAAEAEAEKAAAAQPEAAQEPEEPAEEGEERQPRRRRSAAPKRGAKRGRRGK